MCDLAERLSHFVNANLPGGMSANHLFHYTNLEVLRALLEDDEDMYARHCSFCKGQGEILPGCSAVLDRLVQRRVFSRAQYRDAKCFIKECVAHEDPIFAEQNAMVPYVTCFSYDSDSAFHWKNHTPSGCGCAMRFDRAALDRCVRILQERFKRNSESCDAVMLLPCYYLDAPNIAEYLDIFIDSNIEVFKSFSFDNDGYKSAITTIVLASIMLKQPGFRDEREWRLVRWLSNARLNGQAEVRKQDGVVLQMNKKQLRSDLIYAGFREVVFPFRDLIRGVRLSPSSVSKLNVVKCMFDACSIGYEIVSSRELRRPETQYCLQLTMPEYGLNREDVIWQK